MSSQAINDPAAVAVNVQFQVPATALWFDTGVSSDGATPLAVVYVSGEWTANPENQQMVGPDGITMYVAKPGYNYPGVYEGMLIGKVDEAVFPIGEAVTQVPKDYQGDLLLSINDDMFGQYGKGFTDNVGALTVQVWTPSAWTGQPPGTPEEPLTTGNDYAPYAIVDSNGDIWLFWHRASGGSTRIRYKRYSQANGQWEPDVALPIQPDAADVNDQFPVALPGSNGDIWLFWPRYTAKSNYTIYWDYYEAAAKAWQGNRQLSTKGSKNYDQSVARDGNGDIWVFWTCTDGKEDIYWDRYEAAAKAWQGNHQLSASIGPADGPSAVWNSTWGGGGIWVFYQGDSQSNTVYWYRFNLLPPDGSGRPLTPHETTDICPYSLVDSKGTLWVFWLSNRSGVYEIWYKYIITQSSDFSEATQLTNITISTDHSAYDDTRAILSALVDSHGGIWVFFQKDPGQLFYKYYTDDAGWGSSVQFTAGGGKHAYPSAVEDLEGNIWVFWGVDPNSAPLWYRKLTPTRVTT